MSSLTVEGDASTTLSGGVELVLSALGTHSSHVGIQTNGLRALGALALNGSLRVWLLWRNVGDGGTSMMTDENRVLIAPLGGVELILSALGNHASAVGVQEAGIDTLCLLAVNSSLGACGLLKMCVTMICL